MNIAPTLMCEDPGPPAYKGLKTSTPSAEASSGIEVSIFDPPNGSEEDTTIHPYDPTDDDGK